MSTGLKGRGLGFLFTVCFHLPHECGMHGRLFFPPWNANGLHRGVLALTLVWEQRLPTSSVSQSDCLLMERSSEDKAVPLHPSGPRGRFCDLPEASASAWNPTPRGVLPAPPCVSAWWPQPAIPLFSTKKKWPVEAFPFVLKKVLVPPAVLPLPINISIKVD